MCKVVLKIKVSITTIDFISALQTFLVQNLKPPKFTKVHYSKTPMACYIVRKVIGGLVYDLK
jgi:hypothetical protein